MGNLSTNFSKHEFVCKHCGELKIDNDLIAALQSLRDLTGRPITVNSGYRCPAHNAKVGGSDKSQHLLGKAADIAIQGLRPWRMYDHAMVIVLFRYGGVGVYPDNGFIHVDVRGRRARWIRIGERQGPFSGISL